MSGVPVFPPPIHPEDLGRGPLIMGITWTLTIIALITVVLRFYLRTTVNHSLGWEDWIMGLAMIFDLATTSTYTVAFHYGLGKHDVDLDRPTGLVLILKWTWITVVLGVFVSVLARISIAILLIRLFGVHKWFKYFLIFFTTLQAVAGLLLPFFILLQNDPVTGLWDVFEPNVRHWSPKIEQNGEYLAASIWTFTDLTYALIPVIIIWRLNMDVRRKTALVALMGASLFTTSMSILKILTVHTSSQLTDNVVYSSSWNSITSPVEQNCVIILGCIPTLRSISKLELNTEIFSSLTSFARRFNRSRKSSPNASYQNSATNRYQDLERNTYKLGQLGANSSEQGFVADSNYYPRGSNEVLVAANQVQRVDGFAVSYEKRNEPGKEPPRVEGPRVEPSRVS